MSAMETIDDALATADPVLCNLKITLAHSELSIGLHERLGPESGANFHTWAVWGSKKAGRTIRREDIPVLPVAATAAGGAVGAGAGAIAAVGSNRRGRPVLVAGAAAAGALATRMQVHRGLDTAAEQILGGNVTVLDDIGRATARFLDAFPAGDPPPREAVEEFVAALRPGAPSTDGQDLLRMAFTDYALAWREREERPRVQYMLLANLNAILHEHERLEPYIDAAVPSALRRVITSRLLDFRVGSEDLSVHADVPRVDGRRYAHGLTQIDNPELFLFPQRARRLGPHPRHADRQRRRRLDPAARPHELHLRPLPLAPVRSGAVRRPVQGRAGRRHPRRARARRAAVSGAEWRYCPVCGRELGALTEGPDRGRAACARGHFVYYENPAVTTMAFVQEGEDFLILQRAREPLRRGWDLPGGFVEGGEHPTETVRREVFEETGLEVLPRRLIGVYNGVYGDTGRATLDFAYVCRIRGGHFRLGPKHMDARWYPLDRFPDPAFPSEREALEDLRRRMG